MGVRSLESQTTDRRARSAPALALAPALLAALVIACGGAPRPATVTPATREAVAAADDAERARDHERARTLYEAALREATDAPSRAFAARAFADVLLLWGEGAQAVAQLEVVTTATPDDPSAWHDLGIVRHTLGDVPGARTALERAAGLAPDDPRPHIALAALLWKNGQRTEALSEYRLLLTLELPARVRDKVEWAIGELEKPPD